MKAILDAKFCTDGDFHFENPENLIDPHSSFYENCDIRYNYDEYGETIHFNLVATGSFFASLAVRDLLEALICNLRVGHHSYLVGDIYNMLNSILDGAIYDRDKSKEMTRVDGYLSGNYDGTYVAATIINEHEDVKRTKEDIENEYNQISQDTTMIQDGPNSHKFANQDRRNELLAKYRSMLSEEQQLAIFLHQHLCTANHTDGCSWGYEIHGVIEDWEGYAHKKYLEMAKRMIEKCPDIDMIKSIIIAIENTTYGVS